MKSAGNDIVALSSVNKQRTGEYRFYSKILSACEQALYHQPEFAEMPFENYVWLLWSVKESAYKFLKRAIPHLVFSPTKIIIQCIEIPAGAMVTKAGDNRWESAGNDEAFYSGVAIYGSHTFYFRSKINMDWIATVVNDEVNFENVCWGVEEIDSAGYHHQSKAAKTLLINKLSTFFSGDLQIEKSPAGFPVISNGTANLHIPASLAHDGRFVAYSFMIRSSLQL